MNEFKISRKKKFFTKIISIKISGKLPYGVKEHF